MTEKFEFIGAEYAAYRVSGDMHVPSIVKMCRWMEVSRSGFYEWRNAPESATAKRREELKLLITKAFDGSDGTYGYRRVWCQLARWGVTRVCPLGEMQKPPLTWRHDGRPPLGELVTWTDLELE